MGYLFLEFDVELASPSHAQLEILGCIIEIGCMQQYAAHTLGMSSTA